MWRPIRKHYKVVLVWGVVCLLTFDTATACRFLARRRACRCQCAVTVCEPSCGQYMGPDCSSGGVIKDAPMVTEDVPAAPTPDEPMSPGDKPMPAEADMIPEKPMEAVPAQPALDDMPPVIKEVPMDDQPKAAAPAETEVPAPAEQPAEKPAPKAAIDDLFGDKPAEQPAAPPMPKEAPAAKAPVDDLFGDTPKPAEAPPAAPAAPAAKAPVDDLFGEPNPAPAKPAEPAPAPKKDAVDDLFGGENKPAEPAPPAKETKKAADDPFGAKIDVKDELLVMRQWIDNTGGFTVQGRLIEVQDGKVRLLKDNGKTCTVPMRRLSTEDAQYVQMVVSKLGTGTLIQLASR
jgi:hypothetical protein